MSEVYDINDCSISDVIQKAAHLMVYSKDTHKPFHEKVTKIFEEIMHAIPAEFVLSFFCNDDNEIYEKREYLSDSLIGKNMLISLCNVYKNESPADARKLRMLENLLNQTSHNDDVPFTENMNLENLLDIKVGTKMVEILRGPFDELSHKKEDIDQIGELFEKMTGKILLLAKVIAVYIGEREKQEERCYFNEAVGRAFRMKSGFEKFWEKANETIYGFYGIALSIMSFVEIEVMAIGAAVLSFVAIFTVVFVFFYENWTTRILKRKEVQNLFKHREEVLKWVKDFNCPSEFLWVSIEQSLYRHYAKDHKDIISTKYDSLLVETPTGFDTSEEFIKTNEVTPHVQRRIKLILLIRALRELLRDTATVQLYGPSGSGKTSLIDAMLKKKKGERKSGNLQKHRTRLPRLYAVESHGLSVLDTIGATDAVAMTKSGFNSKSFREIISAVVCANIQVIKKNDFMSANDCWGTHVPTLTCFTHVDENKVFPRVEDIHEEADLYKLRQDGHFPRVFAYFLLNDDGTNAPIDNEEFHNLTGDYTKMKIWNADDVSAWVNELKEP